MNFARSSPQWHRSPGIVIDAELIVPTAEGRSDFAELRRRALLESPRFIEQAAARRPAVLVVFDLLVFGDEDLRHLPLLSRREAVDGPARPCLAFNRSSMSRPTARRVPRHRRARSRRHRREAYRCALPRRQAVNLGEDQEPGVLIARCRRVARQKIRQAAHPISATIDYDDARLRCQQVRGRATPTSPALELR